MSQSVSLFISTRFLNALRVDGLSSHSSIRFHCGVRIAPGFWALRCKQPEVPAQVIASTDQTLPDLGQNLLLAGHESKSSKGAGRATLQSGSSYDRIRRRFRIVELIPEAP